ncbi:hypothetical protein D7252_13745 [Microbacterium sp. CGR2]|nr:hypothetical protein D7252_13745 [Microbacterium sp. CGR2]
MSPDTIPLWFAVPAIVVLWIAWPVYEFVMSRRYWAARDASDPVAVTASGTRRDHYPRACKTEAVR